MNATHRIIFGLIAALAGVQLALWLHLPLPWLLGPLLVSALCSMRSWPLSSHPWLLSAGQWCIGTSLGLYFTPAILSVITAHIPAIVAAVLFAILLGALGAAIYYRIGHVDFQTAWFASAIGGASEMANLATHYQARVDQVVSAHSLRLLLVVMIIPLTYQFLGIQGIEDASSLGKNPHIHGMGLLTLMAWTGLFVWLFKRIGGTNPWVFGPLLATIILTAQDIHLSALPPSIQYLGQLFIGLSLGCKLTPRFFKQAPRFLTIVALTTLAGLLLTALVAWTVSHLAQLPYPVVMLGMAPGGIAEMTITATVLYLSVPLVTVFHVCRMVCVLLSTGPLYRLLSRYFGKTSPLPPK